MPCEENEAEILPPLADDPIINADLRACLLEDIPYDRFAARSCIHCCTEQRIKNFSELYPGAHISMSGEKLKFNFCKTQYSCYKHHALVKSVESINNGLSAVITMIHFIWTPLGKNIKIRQTKEIRHLYNDEIVLIKYRCVTNTPNEIIERAKKLLLNSEDKKYSVLKFNCEHMVRWCVNGTSESLQVENGVNTIARWAFEIGGTIGKLVRWIGKIRDINIIREVTNAAGLSLEEMVSLGGSKFKFASQAVLVATIVFYLIVCIYRTYKTYKQYKRKEICGTCRFRKYADIWLQFVTYIFTNVGGYFLYLLAPGNLLSVFAFAGSLILSLALMHFLPKALNMFKGQFRGEHSIVSDLRVVQKGDVITFHYYKLPHDGIVSDVKIDDSSEFRRGKVTIIHYAWPSFFSKRIVKEEIFDIELDKDKLWINNFNGYNIYQPDEVIRRARLRLNETKFALFSNRSPHFCFWAKVVDFEKEKEGQPCPELIYERPFDEKTDRLLPHIFIDNRIGKLFSSHLTGKREVKSREEIQEGDLIEFVYAFSFYHTAICTEIKRPKEKESEVILTLVHYGNSFIVVEEEIEFDLLRQSLRIHDRHPVHRYSRADIIRRAKAKIGEKKYSYVMHRSSHLTSVVVQKAFDTPIKSLSDVTPGEAVIYSYWGLWHEGIVVEKRDTRLKIVHYGTQGQNLLASREIQAEWTTFRLVEGTNLYKKGFDGYVLYPNEIAVQRAKSRVGEMRFTAFGVQNRSYDFVHWCKVVQSPTVFLWNSEKHLVVPLSGNPKGEYFHEDWVKTWDELEIGVIVLLRGYYGVVVKVTEDDKTIHVRHRRKESIGLITRENEFKIDLKRSKEIIYIYRCDPSKAALSTDIVSTAKSYKGHKKEFEFCKHCVLRDRFDETVPTLIVQQTKSESQSEYKLTYERPFDEKKDRNLTKCIDKHHVNRKEKKTHVNSMDDVDPGDAVIYSYWGLWHEGIVVDKNNKALQIMHYGTQNWNLLANRELILEWEKIETTQGKTRIFKKGFNGHLLYPNDVVVDRALSRKGETRFNSFNNTSHDFVHWCKVVKKPTIYKLRGEDILYDIPQAERLVHETFSKDWVKTWNELQIGSTISLRGFYGILVQIDKEKNAIKIVRRDSKRHEIRSHEFAIDLKKGKEVIHIYSCDPRRSRLASEIVSMALTYKGSKTGWDLFMHCTLTESE